MKVTLLPSSLGLSEQDQRQFLTSFVFNDAVAIDAGSLGLFATPEQQARVRHVLLTHTHIDHLASLPVFVENLYEGKADCVTVHAGAEVLDCLRRDVFNQRLWPDFIGMSKGDSPFLRTALLEAGKIVDLEGLRITPVPVNHVVPTFGFLVADDLATVVIATDTGPTDEVWQRANLTPNLKAVFLEVTFPNSMQWLADLSKHLTPATFAAETRKLTKQVPILVVHIKPRFHPQVVQELHALALPNVAVAEYGKPYTF